MRMRISPVADQVVNNMILITGTGRSGTTIIGNLIGSAGNVEYYFEPPTLLALTSVLNNAGSIKERENISLAIKAYCYEELFIGAITGRYLNFNKADDSYILNIKDKKEIDNRLSGHFRKKEIENSIHNNRLAIKVPIPLIAMKHLSGLYPAITNIMTLRNPNDTINSFVKKGWYDNIDVNSPTVFWPYYVVKNKKVPDWVSNDKFEWWIKSDEINRSAYYLLICWRYVAKTKNKIVIRYEDFIAGPGKKTTDLFHRLNIRPTPNTKKIIRSINEFRQRDYPDILSKVDKKIKKELTELFHSI